jgi:hypothetical protein
MNLMDLLNHFAEWCKDRAEGCFVVMGDDQVLPFATWDEAKAFYRERARSLDGAVESARFFVCQAGQWSEVASPGFEN